MSRRSNLMKIHKLLVTHILLIMLIGCSKKRSTPNDHSAISAKENEAFFDEVGGVKPYNENSQYAAELAECTYAKDDKDSCTLSKLPLLGISKDKITVDDILDRTLISHPFLGEAFKQMLLQMYPETLQMFGSVNAVVISNKINPSYYTATSGAIYLSGRYFWSDAEQREIVTKVVDYRNNFGTSLQFGEKFDYIKDKNSISSRKVNNIRTYNEMFLPVVRLLFHELTHANDYFPRSFYKDDKALDLTLTYKKISNNRYNNYQLISDKQPSELTSDLLKQLGAVLYNGATATETQNSLLATEVADAFKKDVAVAFYSYSTPREDLASNVEASLMLYYYDTSKFLTIHKYPESNFIVPNDYEYQIVWGQKDRILVPVIKERALYAIENILGTGISQKMSEKFENSSALEIPANTIDDDIYNF